MVCASSAMSSSQTGCKAEDASTPMLPCGTGGTGQPHVIRMDSSATNLQSTVSNLYATDSDTLAYSLPRETSMVTSLNCFMLYIIWLNDMYIYIYICSLCYSNVNLYTRTHTYISPKVYSRMNQPDDITWYRCMKRNILVVILMGLYNCVWTLSQQEAIEFLTQRQSLSLTSAALDD